jgi:ribosomal-protein-alanine N-acetyltransferase
LRGNAEHLRPWSPVPRAGEDPSRLTEISKSVIRQRREWTKGEAFVFFITLRSRGEAPIGRVAFTAVVRGAFLSTYLGYWIEADSQGQGLMTDAVGLHRVQAAVMPTNVSSLRVLAKLGFRKEGESLRYLQIAGAWEDHHLFATTVEEWAPRREPTSRSG